MLAVDPIVVLLTEGDMLEAKKGAVSIPKKIEAKKSSDNWKSSKPNPAKKDAASDDLDSVMQFMLDANCTKNQAIAYFKMVMKIADSAHYLSAAGQSKKVTGSFVLSKDLFTDEGWVAMQRKYNKVKSSFIKEMNKIRTEEPEDEKGGIAPKKKVKRPSGKKKDSIFGNPRETKKA